MPSSIPFRQLLDGQDDPGILVATFLAFLELYKRQAVDLRQDARFGDIEIAYLGEPVEASPAQGAGGGTGSDDIQGGNA